LIRVFKSREVCYLAPFGRPTPTLKSKNENYSNLFLLLSAFVSFAPPFAPAKKDRPLGDSKFSRPSQRSPDIPKASPFMMDSFMFPVPPRSAFPATLFRRKFLNTTPTPARS
jgi:hypothetical protein